MDIKKRLIEAQNEMQKAINTLSVVKDRIAYLNGQLELLQELDGGDNDAKDKDRE